MKLSIIVPVYNSEATLNECIECLISQTYKHIEIILVDDGSTDESALICDKFAMLDNRIKVIHKNNEGVSSARNIGMSVSTGDYIIFVDSDDLIDIDACEKIISNIDDHSELFIWNFRRVKGSVGMILPDIEPWEELSELIADIIESRKGQSGLIRAAWAKVYHRSILQGASFPEGQYIGEDACFLLKCFQNVNDISQIKIINESWYNYIYNSHSATQKYKNDLLDQSFKQLSIIEGEIRKLGIGDLLSIQTALTLFSWQTYFDLKLNCLRQSGDEKSSDCYFWQKRTIRYLKNKTIDYKRLPKSRIIFLLLINILPAKSLEKLAELYLKWKKIT